MTIPVVYRQAARRDILDAARDYEAQRRGMGASFIDEIARIETHMADAPRLYQRIDGDVRRAVLRRFPFGLFYLEEQQRILILACLDLRRDPSAISSVVADRDRPEPEP
jgi:plasmid stabilization system protein ParE